MLNRHLVPEFGIVIYLLVVAILEGLKLLLLIFGNEEDLHVLHRELHFPCPVPEVETFLRVVFMPGRRMLLIARAHPRAHELVDHVHVHRLRDRERWQGADLSDRAQHIACLTLEEERRLLGEGHGQNCSKHCSEEESTQCQWDGEVQLPLRGCQVSEDAECDSENSAEFAKFLRDNVLLDVILRLDLACVYLVIERPEHREGNDDQHDRDREEHE